MANPNDMGTKFKKMLVLIAFILFSISLIGAFYLLTPGATAGVAFAYAVGLSMIVLPCTLPLAFVIVPLAMGKSPKKGLLMALFFGLGLSITLSVYGLFVALIGKSIGLDSAISEAGVVSSVLFMIGGLAAFALGLSELKLIKFKMPSYKGSYPDFIQKQGDYLKVFLLGLFLGNAGVGCPNPLFYVLLGDIAVSGSVANGLLLGFVHGVGRATPLIFLVILGILGVNAVSGMAKKTDVVTKWTGVALILLGSLIFIMGASHKWYEQSILHKSWNKAVLIVTGEGSGIVEKMDAALPDVSTKTPDNSKEEKEHEDGNDFIPAPWSWITLLTMIFVPLGLYWYKEKN